MPHDVIIPSSQRWLLVRMRELGYALGRLPEDYIGQCYGFSRVGVNAFLTGKFTVLHARIMQLATMPRGVFRRNFEILRMQQQQLLHISFNDCIEEARVIQQKIVDILAFFDAVVAYQTPYNYKHLFDDIIAHEEYAQAKEIMSPLVEPSIFTQHPELKPCVVAEVIGGYTREELQMYFDLLMQFIGTYSSFAIMFICDLHAINLNYDALAKHWIMLDSERLPPKIYTDLLELVAALFQTDQVGIAVKTIIFVQNQYHTESVARFTDLQQINNYKLLHDVNKLSNQAGIYRSGSIIDVLVDADLAPITHAMMLAACYEKSYRHTTLSIFNQYLSQGNIPSEDLFITACFEHKFELAEAILKNGVSITEDHLALALCNADLEFAEFCIQHGCVPNNVMLHVACEQNNLAGIQFLLDQGLFLTRIDLALACAEHNIATIKFIIKHGITPTQQMFDEARKNQHLAVKNALYCAPVVFNETAVDNVVLPNVIEQYTQAALFDACIVGNIEQMRQLLQANILISKDMFQQLCLKGNILAIIYVLKQIPDDFISLSLLKKIARYRQYDMLKLLLENCVIYQSRLPENFKTIEILSGIRNRVSLIFEKEYFFIDQCILLLMKKVDLKEDIFWGRLSNTSEFYKFLENVVFIAYLSQAPILEQLLELINYDLPVSNSMFECVLFIHKDKSLWDIFYQNRIDMNMSSPLFRCFTRGYLAEAQYLLRRGAQIEPIHFKGIVTLKDTEQLTTMLQCIFDVGYVLTDELMQWSYENSTPEIYALISKEHLINGNYSTINV